MQVTVPFMIKLAVFALTLATNAQVATGWSCGTHASDTIVESLLSSQSSIFGKAIYQMSNATERALVSFKSGFPDGVKIKVRVVNCARNTFKGFSRSIEKLDDGFNAAKISFRLEKVVDCPHTTKVDKFCTKDFAPPSKKCPDTLRSISNKIGYTDGLLIIVIDDLTYPIMGQADLGLIPKDPWIMVQAKSLPDNSPAKKVRTANRSVQIKNNGHTLVHEVGHAFGLFHTFENGCNYPGDYIPDTPYQSNAMSRLPSFFPTLQCCALHPTVECAPPPTCKHAIGNNFDNFMDYSPESCSKRFTPGQIAVMQATILARRPAWLGSSKKKSLQDIAISQKLGFKRIQIQGNFKGSKNSIDWPELCEGPDGSQWRNEYKHKSSDVIRQPANVVYRLNISRSFGSVQITQCRHSSKDENVSLAYLVCEGASCVCQVFQCTSDEKLPKMLSKSPSEDDKDYYLIVSNDADVDDNATFTLDVHADMDQSQPLSPQTVPSTSIHAARQCLYSDAYNFYVPRAPCKQMYLSSSLDCEDTKVTLMSKKQLNRTSSTSYWDVQTKIRNTKSQFGLLNHGRQNCQSLYLSPQKAAPSMDGENWKWSVVPVKNDSCDMVRLLVNEGSNEGKYISANENCVLKFSRSRSSAQIFGVKDRNGRPPKQIQI